jgi:tRNA U34 2-thiouridine synthase MnmA/TrmU
MDRRGPGSLHLELTRTFSGLAPGQAAVLYRDDVIVGGGTIGRVPEGVVG